MKIRHVRIIVFQYDGQLQFIIILETFSIRRSERKRWQGKEESFAREGQIKIKQNARICRP